jgi:hypothetical protein
VPEVGIVAVLVADRPIEMIHERVIKEVLDDDVPVPNKGFLEFVDIHCYLK